ncbi:MAG: hypothetical protein EA381_16485 [Planctomycetaceae bacterium]|nr:MAG: hypothetical protein EA381_16485 [Planctomycetaceae bacterium]
MHRFSLPFRPRLAAVFGILLVGVTWMASVAQPLRAQDGSVPGADREPVVVVTVASLNKLIADVDYVTGVVGQPQFGGIFSMMAATFSQGLDTSRPVAVMVPVIDGVPAPIGLVPTTDVEMMLKRNEGNIGPADKLDDGTLVIAAGNNLVYIRQVGTWAAVASDRDMLDQVPADPDATIQGMGDKYDIAVRLNASQIPMNVRETYADQLRQGLEQFLESQPGADPQSLQLGMSQLEQFKSLILETDRVLFGLNINPAKRLINIDTAFTATPGSSLASLYSGQKAIPSALSAVLRANSAIRYHAASSIAPETAEMFDSSLDTAMESIAQLLDDQDQIGEDVKAEIEELLEGLLEIASKTMKEGKSDVGLAVVADDGVFRLAGGGFLYSGEAFADWLQKLDTKLRQIPNPPVFRFNESTYKDVAMHSITIDIPNMPKQASDLMGPQIVIHLGTGPQSAYFGVGKESPAMMKRLIDTAGADEGDLADRPLGQMRIRVLPLLRLSQSIRSYDQVATMLDAVALASEHDFIQASTTSIPNGQASSLEIGEGLLRLIGVGIREMQNAQLRQVQQGGF